MSEAAHVPIEIIWLEGDVFNNKNSKDRDKRLNETVILYALSKIISICKYCKLDTTGLRYHQEFMTAVIMRRTSTELNNIWIRN